MEYVIRMYRNLKIQSVYNMHQTWEKDRLGVL